MSPKTPELCYKGWAMSAGNSSGRCCCNCKWSRPISGHPWNTNPLTKTQISVTIGYGCCVPEMPNITFMEQEHSMCEMHDWKELNEQAYK